MRKLILVLGFLLVLFVAGSVSAVNPDNLQAKVNELEERVAALEGNQTVHETRISALESLVDFIHAQLESVKEWLFFWTYEQGDVCDAVESGCVQPQINCSSDAECGTDAGDRYCSDGDVYQDFVDGVCVNPGTEESFCSYMETSFTPILVEDCDPDQLVNGTYCVGDDVYQDYRDYFCVDPGTEGSYCGYTDNPILKEDCADTCVDGGCVILGPGKVIFRTNVVQGDGQNYNIGNTSDGLGAWIALDADGDESLEGYGRTNGVITTGCDVPEEEIGRTSDGFKLIKDEKGDIGVCYKGDTGYARRYSVTDSDAENAVLSTTATEPYASNGQELYEGFIFPEGDGSSDDGGDDNGGVNVSIDVDWGTS